MCSLFIDIYKIFVSDAGDIKWDYFVKLQNLQETIGLKFGNKLSKAHVRFLNNKMKVKYAVQTLSSSVADAMEVLNLLEVKEFEGCEATVEFIRILDRIFDFLNSRNPRGKGYKQPICAHELPYFERKIAEWTNYLYSLRLKNDKRTPLHLSRRRTFIFGLSTAMKSIFAISCRLLKTPFYKCV